MSFCKVSKANIYYEVIGTGTPIVMLHGYSPDHRLMKGCMEPVFAEREGWKRIYIDLPGMGKTTDYEKINNSDEMLEAVVELIHSLIPNESYLLVGESYGGYLVRGIMREYHEQILGAAFICPLIIPDKEGRTVPKQSIVLSDKKFLSTITKEELEDFSSHLVVLDQYNCQRYTNEVLAGCKIANIEFLEKVQNSYDFSFAVDELTFDKPSLFLLGKQDSIVGYKDAFAFLDKYPRATFSILDKAGHNLQIEQAYLFNSLMYEWLDRVEEYTRSND
ncbi:2-hydroxy-6-oxo-6-phenylhexa-2,4-dienoate hydrolase [Lysinibacillus sphaericus]|uniref:alpha/beta fold hydrolase n=1 Tax=Lysinibacillus sphaericus TaxID=1421 RepID=UPI0018CE051E|nr:alpha/beta hydrolase [Lysinibacillus sphaericus]MBG9453874.1 2-hydroxy-6-oxo-6-phenylhexa-2,4-dienoate hydrolase [Lysinibacillus sphaericus]MBG9476344.1 2-hydroxy-6-oxo-6-phenylhexa-2,4-dienoate hydrolase [Lysinibacillus sphaericus]MBG9591759.1 2-hydroxy-6-oxo-6-phenylhexa-2,4-dienoate hydrolase [Lysinibacillus sphaericus]